MATKSIESAVIDHCGTILKKNGIKRYYLQQDSINSTIDRALEEAPSKSGGKGGNRPDISMLITDGHGRYIPVMIEAKGTEGKLVRMGTDGLPEMKDKDGNELRSAVSSYAVNGALHYADAVVEGSDYKEAIALGINGTEIADDGNVKRIPKKRAFYIMLISLNRYLKHHPNH